MAEYAEAYISPSRFEKYPIEIVEISEKERDYFHSVVERFYDERPDVIRNEYIFSRVKGGEIVWKLARINGINIWFPLDRLPIKLEEMIENGIDNK